jgi:hypothetical protein
MSKTIAVRLQRNKAYHFTSCNRCIWLRRILDAFQLQYGRGSSDAGWIQRGAGGVDSRVAIPEAAAVLDAAHFKALGLATATTTLGGLTQGFSNAVGREEKAKA